MARRNSALRSCHLMSGEVTGLRVNNEQPLRPAVEPASISKERTGRLLPPEEGYTVPP